MLLGEPEDLERSLEYNSRALALTSDDHPQLLQRHRNLAIFRFHQFQRTGDLSYSKRSLNSFRSASQLLIGSPRVKFNHALLWTRLASEHSSLNSIEAYQVTLNLLPQFIWLGATTSQPHQDLLTVESLAVNAASGTIFHSGHSLALEWLEHAPGVVWNQSLMLRSPLDQLHSFHPNLATGLQLVANRLHSAGCEKQVTKATVNPKQADNLTIGADFAKNPHTNAVFRSQHIFSGESKWSDSRINGRILPKIRTKGADSEQAGQERRLAGEYHRLLDEIRELAGFEGFLQPTKAKSLISAARTGPVVVLSCHEHRYDAPLVFPGQQDIRHLHLPTFTKKLAQSAWSDIEASLRRMRLRERGVRMMQEPGYKDHFEIVLALLWDEIVKPILEFLGYMNDAPTDSLPHITWCATGALSPLSLHAAGDYNQPRSRVFDYVISSYTPTLTSLLSSTTSVLNSGCRVLGIGQANMPGHNRLPGTVEELASLESRIKGNANYSQLMDKQATTAAVLDAMEQHNWVHLACHARQNVSDPTESRFYLYDGALDLRSINQQSFRNKGLAFLPACQTGTGGEKLPDEAIHLAAGMLMAGYSSVIATMWSVVDQDAPLVSDKVVRSR